MPTSHYRLTIALPPQEREHLDRLAEQLRLSRPELLRRLVMGRPLPNPAAFVAWDGIRDLIKVNADQARLGNLFKLALDEELPASLVTRLDTIADDIETTQKTLKTTALDIRSLIHARRV